MGADLLCPFLFIGSSGLWHSACQAGYPIRRSRACFRARLLSVRHQTFAGRGGRRHLTQRERRKLQRSLELPRPQAKPTCGARPTADLCRGKEPRQEWQRRPGLCVHSAYVIGQPDFGMKLVAAPEVNGETVYYCS